MINLGMLIKVKEYHMMMYYNKKRDYKFKCLIAILNSMKNRLKDLEEKQRSYNNKIKIISINLLWLKILKNNFKQL